MARYDRLEAADGMTAESVALAKTSAPDAVLGMALMSGAMLTAPAMDVLAKYLGTVEAVSPGVVTLGRFAVQASVLFIFLAVLFLAGHGVRLWPARIAGNLLRGGLMGVASFLFFTAVTFMPVADAIAIFFVEPFILTILSALLLGEIVGWRRRIAILVGFSGALLVIQPSFSALGFVAVLPIAAAFVFALYLIYTRKIATGDEPLAMQFVAGIGGAMTLTAGLFLGASFGFAPLAAVFPQTPFSWGLIVLLGLLGTVSHLMIVFAFARVRASVLAPFQYIEIVSATILGFFVFDEFPNILKWLGIAIVVGSGIYIFWREAQLSKQEEPVS